MIYEWKCPQCKMITEVNRPVADYQLPPEKDDERHKMDCTHPKGELVRVISKSSTPFEHLRDQGVLERIG